MKQFIQKLHEFKIFKYIDKWQKPAILRSYLKSYNCWRNHILFGKREMKARILYCYFLFWNVCVIYVWRKTFLAKGKIYENFLYRPRTISSVQLESRKIEVISQNEEKWVA